MMTSLAQVLRTGAAVAAAAALLAACGSSVKLDDTPVESRTGSAVSQPGASEGAPRLIGSGSGASGAASGSGTASGAGQSNPNAQTNVASIQAGSQGQGAAGASGTGAGSAAAGGAAGGSNRGAAGGAGGVAGTASGAAGAGSGAGSLAARSGAALPSDMARVVYFDFDSFVLRDDARPVVEAHARMLMGDRGRRLVIEGHTDERGSREYNLALGQKRADAVARALVLLGVQESQVEAVSFGEERPAERSAGENAWSKNRRAELKDRP